MALPAPPPLPFLTETTYWRRILGRTQYVSCTEAVAVQCAHHADPSIPVTRAEMIALYNTGSHTTNGGRTLTQIAGAIATRYGHKAEVAPTFDAALEALRAGRVLAVSGNYHNLPAELQRWDRHFAASSRAWHEVAVGPIAEGDTSDDPLVWWRDPLGYGTYAGQWAWWRDVKRFAAQPFGILAFPYLEWSMSPITITGPGGGTGTVVDDPLVRLIDPAGVTVVPKYRTYDLGWAVTIGGYWSGPGHFVNQDGRMLVLLNRNAVIMSGPLMAYTITGIVGDTVSSASWR